MRATAHLLMSAQREAPLSAPAPSALSQVFAFVGASAATRADEPPGLVSPTGTGQDAPSEEPVQPARSSLERLEPPAGGPEERDSLTTASTRLDAPSGLAAGTLEAVTVRPEALEVLRRAWTHRTAQELLEEACTFGEHPRELLHVLARGRARSVLSPRAVIALEGTPATSAPPVSEVVPCAGLRRPRVPGSSARVPTGGRAGLVAGA